MQSKRFLLCAAMLTSLYLSACATSPANGGSNGSDLDVLALGVKALLPTREPAGTVKLAEDARTGEQVWDLALDLEDVDFMHERDKVRTIDFVDKAVDTIKKSRRVCTGWDRLWNLRECR